MRDPKRLDNFYETIKRIHQKYFPDWRYGQLMSNWVNHMGQDIFYWEEDRIIDGLYEYVYDITGEECDIDD